MSLVSEHHSDVKNIVCQKSKINFFTSVYLSLINKSWVKPLISTKVTEVDLSLCH